MSRTVQHMAVSYDNTDLFKFVSGHDQQVLAWADHECACQWPKCNGVPAEFLQ